MNTEYNAEYNAEYNMEYNAEYNEAFCTDIRGFAEKVCKEVSRRLGDDYQVKLQEVTKNNGVILQGLVILTQDRNVSPTIYLNTFMEAYEAGMPFIRIVDQVLEIYRQDLPKRDVDMTFFRDFEKVKDRICYKLIGREKNRALLERIPHVDFLDLSICFYYAYKSRALGHGSILIYNNHMEMWGSSVEELFSLARVNTPRLFPWEVHSMEEMLEELVKETGGTVRGTDMTATREDGLRILSNARRIHGATCILYPKVLEIMADRIGGNFYILPSSIHEVILLGEGMAGDEKTLLNMVREINATQVEPEEVLSDNLYFYHYLESKISIRC